MGVALWLAAAVTAFVLARLIPAWRPEGLAGELMATAAAAAIFGLLATALDFGGWREPDWRAGVFALCGALGAAGALRALRLAQRTAGH
jgi:hypothetical protein